MNHLILSVASEGRWNATQKKNLKLLQKTGVIFQVYILSEKRQNSQKYLGRHWKSQFSIEILIKKPQNFLENFQTFFVFGRKEQSFACSFRSFHSPMEIIRQMLITLHFSTNSSRFSPKLSKIFIQFAIVLLDLSHFKVCFDEFLN